MLTYQVFKMLHILGVVLFLGNIITAAFWKTFADQTRRPEVVALANGLSRDRCRLHARRGGADPDWRLRHGAVAGLDIASTPSCSTAWRCLIATDLVLTRSRSRAIAHGE